MLKTWNNSSSKEITKQLKNVRLAEVVAQVQATAISMEGTGVEIAYQIENLERFIKTCSCFKSMKTQSSQCPWRFGHWNDLPTSYTWQLKTRYMYELVIIYKEHLLTQTKHRRSYDYTSSDTAPLVCKDMVNKIATNGRNRTWIRLRRGELRTCTNNNSGKLPWLDLTLKYSCWIFQAWPTNRTMRDLCQVEVTHAQ